jgi:exodeoxyribonuclease VII large subunit
LQVGLQLAAQRESHRLERLQTALPQAVLRTLEQRAQRLQRCGSALGLLDPRLVLERGYALLTDAQGLAITRASQVAAGQALQARLADGELALTVNR